MKIYPSSFSLFRISDMGVSFGVGRSRWICSLLITPWFAPMPDGTAKKPSTCRSATPGSVSTAAAAIIEIKIKYKIVFEEYFL